MPSGFHLRDAGGGCQARLVQVTNSYVQNAEVEFTFLKLKL
jgi:hypothetical protein